MNRAQRSKLRLLGIVPALTALLALAPAAAGVEAPARDGRALRPVAAATLEQCVTVRSRSARSATFAGEMTAIPGSARMEMRIELLERLPAEARFHAVAGGLGTWRTAAFGVTVYRYLRQVTNLAAPAFYRAAVRFRWRDASGRLLRSQELRTPQCAQPSASPRETPPAAIAPASGA